MLSNVITGIGSIVTISLISSTIISTIISVGCRSTYDTLVNFIPKKVSLEDAFEYIRKNDMIYKIERMNNVINDIKNRYEKENKIDKMEKMDNNLSYIYSNINSSNLSLSSVKISADHLLEITNRASDIIAKLNKYKNEQDSLYFGNWSMRQYNCREELTELVYCNTLFDIRFDDLQKIININK